MLRKRSKRIARSAGLSWKQRIVACLFLPLSLFLVIDPLWECHDHLDNLRHLGPHGALMILLIVACASVILLKSKSSLGLLFLSLIAGMAQPQAVMRPIPRGVTSLAFATLPPPLRI